ncbi:MAG TPA: prolyl aminopeptidase [Bacteroidetes bacterium]|nr:prolyl aminopeptidase [Bacteroidota bacterium]
MKTSGHVPVPGGHELYYELFGAPDGLPVLYLHGGPGAGFTEKDKIFFDPDKHHVLFFDQRGAGRSRPFASLKNNTTGDLIRDINLLLERFGMERVLLFGGSWGSTLALVYAIRYPERVSGLLLRGIFPGHIESTKYYINGGVRTFFPDAWERFLSHVPQKNRLHPARYYYRMMQSRDEAVREKYSYEWAFYEFSIFKQEPLQENEIDTLLRNYSYRSLAPMEAWYVKNNFFLPDNYIYDHAEALSQFPVSIVHGRYDMICPPVYAWELHRKIAGSRLRFTCAGHAASEPETEAALKEELDILYDEIQNRHEHEQT